MKGSDRWLASRVDKHSNLTIRPAVLDLPHPPCPMSLPSETHTFGDYLRPKGAVHAAATRCTFQRHKSDSVPSDEMV